MTYPKLTQTKRRCQVARLRLHQLTYREIADELKVSHVTVARDLIAIEADWRAQAARDLGEHKSRELAMLHEVEHVAWLQSPPDLAIILRTSEQRCKLLQLYGYAPGVDVEGELREMGLDPAIVIAKVEAYLAGGNP